MVTKIGRRRGNRYYTQPETATGDVTVSVRMQTNKGTIVLELDAEKAPETVANFLEYARSGFYDGTISHRPVS